MEELLVPGETVGWIVPVPPSPSRATDATLVAVRHGRTTVSVDTGLATRLLGRELPLGTVPGIPGGAWQPEVREGPHRFDFGVRAPHGRGWSALLEVKSSNLRVGTTALFPDAPTERGRRHLDALADFAGPGRRADVVFAIQRDDVTQFRPNAALDPAFAAALGRARAAGVGVHALTLRVRPDRVSLGRRVPVVLPNVVGDASYQPI
jgi:sugar fermentation stimulation protein A